MGGYAGFVDDGNPGVMEEVTKFGTVRWGAEGTNECPLAGGGGDGGVGDEDPDGEGDTPPPFEPNPEYATNQVSLSLDRTALRFDDFEGAPIPLERVDFNDPTLAATLMELGGLTLQKSFPGSTPAQTLGQDYLGRQIGLPDVSDFYIVTFSTVEEAYQAIEPLLRLHAIRSANIMPGYARVTTIPNDPYFDCWRDNNPYHDIPSDAQWQLLNDGERRADWYCNDAIRGYDVRAGNNVLQTLTRGDTTIVIGIVDVGVYNEHEDLNVYRPAFPDSVGRPGFPDWCGIHGTMMAGLAAARVNNGRGVAGVCGGCSILDINVPGCLTCAQDCGSIWARWHEKVRGALNTVPADRFKVLNLSFASRDFDVLPEAFLILWRAHLQGTVAVAASGDQSNGQPHRVAPANVPFVLGVGGSTWEGMFWDRTTTCYGNGNGTVLGPGNADICAPASGLMATTSPLYSSETSCYGTPVGYYRVTTGQASGACAMTAGAVGLIQSNLHHLGLPFSADDMVGLLEATAYPFRVDPASPAYPRDCPIELCPREYYGRGILNLRDAMDLAEQVAQGGGINERIARKDAPYVESWTVQEVNRFTLRDTLFVQYQITAVVDLVHPVNSPPGSSLPLYVAWVRSSQADTYTDYSRICYGCDPNANNIDLARRGVRDARMGLIDQTQGKVTITSADYAWSYGGGELHWFVDPDTAKIPYVVVSHTPVGIEEPEGPEVPVLAIMTKRRILDRRFDHIAGLFLRPFCAASASRFL